MAYRLRSGVHFCLVGGRPIFLDLISDRYFCFSSAEQNVAFSGLLAGDNVDIQVLQPHFTSGLILDAGNDEALQPCGEKTSSVREVRAGAGNWPRALGFGAAFMRSRRALRKRTAQQVLERLRSNQLSANDVNMPLDLAAQINGTVERAALIFGTFDRCLPKAVALSEIIMTLGYRPTVVFGVTGRPFSAHCWTRVGEVLLAESVSRVRNYTPILTL